MENQNKSETDFAALKSIIAELQDITKSEKASAALQAIRKELDHLPRYAQFQLRFLKALRNAYVASVPQRFENEFTAAYNGLRTELTDRLSSVDGFMEHGSVGFKRMMGFLEPSADEGSYDGFFNPQDF